MTRFPRLAPLALLLVLPAMGADTYKIDATHSEVSFKIRHLLSKTPGHFAKFEGAIQIDEKDMAKSSVEVTIQAASISTDSEQRDNHLRSADFFDVAKYPTITFKSTSVKEVAKGRLEIAGDLTLHGVTKRVSFPMTNLGTMATPFKDVRAGFTDGALTLNRFDYGIAAFKGVLGEDVEISLNVEAVKVEAPAVTPAK
ncbi:MAG TPA: YceI family protein [Holophagaceae bacterium]|nr:YceI family protein [Holophagaceae bacterium]